MNLQKTAKSMTAEKNSTFRSLHCTRVCFVCLLFSKFKWIINVSQCHNAFIHSWIDNNFCEMQIFLLRQHSAQSMLVKSHYFAAVFFPRSRFHSLRNANFALFTLFFKNNTHRLIDSYWPRVELKPEMCWCNRSFVVHADKSQCQLIVVQLLRRGIAWGWRYLIIPIITV